MPNRQSSETTKEKIKDAFLTLYENNTIDRISIRKLADLAGVNRATFYSHYTDIYDLFERIKDEKYEILYGKLTAVLPVAMMGGEYKDFIPDEGFFTENEKWMRVLVGMYGKSDIVERVKENIKIMICKDLGLDPQNHDPETDYALEYMLSANAGVFTRWIQKRIWRILI